MSYIFSNILPYQTDEVDLFSDDDMDGDIQPIPREDYERLIEFLQNYNPPAILPIQIAYYAGLRIGEACGLAWHDVNLEEQCLTIRRSIRYDGSRHKNIIGPTKRKKVRIVDFGDTLAEILRTARKEQLKNRMQYGELYHKNYYREVKDKNRAYYEFYHLDGTENVPEDYKEISFVCLRPDGSLELPSTLGIVCRKIAQKLDGFEGFHFLEIPTQELIILLSGFLISKTCIKAKLTLHILFRIKLLESCPCYYNNIVFKTKYCIWVLKKYISIKHIIFFHIIPCLLEKSSV